MDLIITIRVCLVCIFIYKHLHGTRCDMSSILPDSIWYHIASSGDYSTAVVVYTLNRELHTLLSDMVATYRNEVLDRICIVTADHADESGGWTFSDDNYAWGVLVRGQNPLQNATAYISTSYEKCVPCQQEQQYSFRPIDSSRDDGRISNDIDFITFPLTQIASALDRKLWRAMVCFTEHADHFNVEWVQI